MAFKPAKLNCFSLAMINVALVMSLGGLPIMAREGLSMFFYILFASVLFLLPISLVIAELATGWPKPGGVFLWVKEAFGTKWGFSAIWLQWIQTTILYPIILAFAAGSLSYLFLDPKIATSKLYNMCVIIVFYWGATFLNFRRFKLASWFTTICVICGTIIPAILIISLGFSWVISGNPIEFLQTSHSFIPNFSRFSNVALLAGTLLSFTGMEVGAVHVKQMKDPLKDYPRSIFIAFVVVFVVFLLGSLSIAVCIPKENISLTAGIMQAFKDLLHQFHLDFLLPFFSFLLAFGAIGSLVAWISGPPKGLLATAKYGELPPFLQYTNKFHRATHILWVQGIIVTILSFIFLFMTNVSIAFYLLTTLTVILYLIMYILLYASAIKLRYSKPEVPRRFEIPGGKIGIWLVGGIGILAVLFTIVVGFFPPSELQIVNTTFYVLFLLIGISVFVSVPLLINRFKKPHWKKNIIDKH